MMEYRVVCGAYRAHGRHSGHVLTGIDNLDEAVRLASRIDDAIFRPWPCEGAVVEGRYVTAWDRPDVVEAHFAALPVA